MTVSYIQRHTQTYSVRDPHLSSYLQKEVTVAERTLTYAHFDLK